jgi:hypothetical protein
MTKRRRRLVHLLVLATRQPLCGGSGVAPSTAAVNGVAICADCARRMSLALETAIEVTPQRPPTR